MSRAETIRQRRVKDAEKQQEQSRLHNYRVMRPATTVVTRSFSQTTPLYQSGRIRSRKAHYFNIKGSSGEVRVRSMPNIHFGWRALSGAFSVLLFILIMFLAISPSFKVSRVNITGLVRLSALEVESSLQVGNTPIFAVNPNQLIDSLSNSYPELMNVRISVSLPATISITATERVPIISWVTSEHTYWIDLEGAVFPARGDAIPPLTIITDDVPPAAEGQAVAQENAFSFVIPIREIDPAVLNAILDLSSRMPQETTFLYDAQNGLGWNDSRGWQVFIGLDLGNLPIKISEYEVIVAQLDLQGIHPVMVSVEHIDAPFFRTE